MTQHVSSEIREAIDLAAVAGHRWRGKKAPRLNRDSHDLRGTFATRCLVAATADQDITDILERNAMEMATTRTRYVDQARAVVDLGKRITAAKV